MDYQDERLAEIAAALETIMSQGESIPLVQLAEEDPAKALQCISEMSEGVLRGLQPHPGFDLVTQEGP